VGISLGGNMLLKWLGERGEEARAIIAAAAGVSAPVDLMAGGTALGRGFNRFYTWMFLRTLKAKSRAKLAQHADLFDRARMEAARDLHAFDDVVTAPVHGFVDADDYWTRASSKPWLRRIAVPTLVLNARNDPFLPPAALPGPGDVSGFVTLEQPVHGGHVGFLAAGAGGADWMPRRVLRFLAAHVPASDP
jgi:predicted alpha/beta-fold hydrolase